METMTQRICAALAVGLCWGLLAMILVGDMVRARE